MADHEVFPYHRTERLEQSSFDTWSIRDYVVMAVVVTHCDAYSLEVIVRVLVTRHQ